MGMTHDASSNSMEIPDGVMKPKSKSASTDDMNPYKKLGKGLLGGLSSGLEQYGQQPNQNFYGGY